MSIDQKKFQCIRRNTYLKPATLEHEHYNYSFMFMFSFSSGLIGYMHAQTIYHGIHVDIHYLTSHTCILEFRSICTVR